MDRVAELSKQLEVTPQTIQALQGGDTDALETVIAVYREPITMFCRRSAKLPQDAEEIAADIFIRVWDRVGRTNEELRNPYKFRGWLYTIAARTCINASRRGVSSGEGNRLSLDQLVDEENRQDLLTDTRCEDPEKMVLQQETSDRIQAALSQINSGFAEVVRLADLGYTYIEMAEKLGIPEGTVMSRLHRGRRRISRLIADQSEYLAEPQKVA